VREGEGERFPAETERERFPVGCAAWRERKGDPDEAVAWGSSGATEPGGEGRGAAGSGAALLRCTNLRRIPLPTAVHHAAMARPRGGEGRGGEMESRERTDGIGKGRSGRLEWRRWGGKIRIWKIFIEMENCYQASQNRVVPRAGTMSRSVSPSTIDLSCWAGPRHYQS
jgi:hypothetical protein